MTALKEKCDKDIAYINFRIRDIHPSHLFTAVPDILPAQFGRSGKDTGITKAFLHHIPYPDPGFIGMNIQQCSVQIKNVILIHTITLSKRQFRTAVLSAFPPAGIFPLLPPAIHRQGSAASERKHQRFHSARQDS